MQTIEGEAHHHAQGGVGLRRGGPLSSRSRLDLDVRGNGGKIVQCAAHIHQPVQPLVLVLGGKGDITSCEANGEPTRRLIFHAGHKLQVVVKVVFFVCLANQDEVAEEIHKRLGFLALHHVGELALPDEPAALLDYQIGLSTQLADFLHLLHVFSRAFALVHGVRNFLHLAQRHCQVLVVNVRGCCVLQQLLQQQHVSRYALHRHDQEVMQEKTRAGLFLAVR
mmetsp:Transcript_18032/g.45818  ORF Transcript_18032/g.45818 Transcript_18032/m.45818 type:complete len:223 (+) Transcript_18032:77-745(+)